MARKKENKRADGYYEYKCIVDRKFDGTPIYKSFYSKKSKADARLKAEQYKIDLERKKDEQENISFTAWADIFLAHQKEKVKINTYSQGYESVFKCHLKPWFGDKLLKHIMKTDIEDYVNEKLLKLKNATVQTHVSMLSKCFSEAIDNGYLSYNPCKNVHVKSSKSTKRVYTQEQTDLVLDYCKRDVFGLPVHLMLSYGMSRSELMGITYDDVDFENLTISINKGLTAKLKYTETAVIAETKNKFRNRTIAISQETADYIKEFVEFGFLVQPDEKTIPSTETFRGRYNAFMKRMIKYYEKQGISIPKLNPHELRHTRASLWVNQGKNLFAICEMLGWSDLTMLRKVYGHPDIQQLRKELDL